VSSYNINTTPPTAASKKIIKNTRITSFPEPPFGFSGNSLSSGVAYAYYWSLLTVDAKRPSSSFIVGL